MTITWPTTPFPTLTEQEAEQFVGSVGTTTIPARSVFEGPVTLASISFSEVVEITEKHIKESTPEQIAEFILQRWLFEIHAKIAPVILYRAAGIKAAQEQ